MTELFEPTGPFDRRLALSADGVLAEANAAGVLTAADVHVARRLAHLAGESDESVQLAVALTTRAVRLGSVCVDLALVPEIAPDLRWPDPDAWAEAVRSSPLVEQEVLHWEHDLLYLDRYRRQEVQVREDLTARWRQPQPPVDRAALEAAALRVFPEDGYAEQRAAAVRAARSWTTVLTGGPGTGKTTAVAGMLALLAEQAELAGDRLRIALAAPTGKAAARLGEAVAEATANLPAEDRDRLGSLEARTLHRLLGTRQDNSTRFRHHRGNRLPHDVVVVDETSMVSLTLMARLLEAARPDARLVLVGDPDQLASVDAGAVLADLVAGLADVPDSPVVSLRTAHRYGEVIGGLAEALRAGDEDGVLAALRAGHGEVEFVETAEPAEDEDAAAPAAEAWERLRPRLVESALAVRRRAEAGDADGALAALQGHRLLCAHREGPFGVRAWNQHVERAITEETGDPLWDPMYVGRPLLVTANDYGLGLFNGDTGVVIRLPDGRLRAIFATATGTVELAPSRLADIETMHAMTIHKAQGSQAEEVTVLLPPPDSPLATRELVYTAVTRARERISVVGPASAVLAAVRRRVQRASGLRQRLGEAVITGPTAPEPA